MVDQVLRDRKDDATLAAAALKAASSRLRASADARFMKSPAAASQNASPPGSPVSSAYRSNVQAALSDTYASPPRVSSSPPGARVPRVLAVSPVRRSSGSDTRVPFVLKCSPHPPKAVQGRMEGVGLQV